MASNDPINSYLRAARAGNAKKVFEYLDNKMVDINSSNANGLTVLHSASKEGHDNLVKELLDRGANVHAATQKGNTALHIASLAGHETVADILISHGADVNVQSTSGFTALYMAAQENHILIVKLLLSNGANQNLATAEGFTPLAVAMQQGHEQVATLLLNNESKGRIRFSGTTESGRSLLHIAAKKDDCAAAALLIQNNISPDVTSKSGFTALHVASHYGNEAVAKLLLSYQANVNFQAKHNITPLHVAAKWGKEKLVDLLIENGATINATTKDGLTPLHCAARSGRNDVVDILIRKGAPISAATRSGLAPLHMATQGDHDDSARLLLHYKAPVNDVTNDYLTALHVASHCGHVKVAKLLLDHKADPNFKALNGFTSLHIACKKNRLAVVELLLRYGASLNSVTESGLTPLHVAAFMGNIDIVIYLIQNHADIETSTVRGETPLHLAARANQIDVINILLRHGADVEAKAKESQTALHIASRLGNAEIADLLIRHGIPVDAPTKDSYTALHIAAKEGHDEVVEVLLDHGANITCATKNHGFTPLHLASKYGIGKVVELLLENGALIDAQGKNGVTPLHVATHYGHPHVVQLLLSKGASPHVTAKNGYTSLHIAAKGNRLDVATALLEYGSKPNADSKAGFTPLHLAGQEGRADMAALLINNGANVNARARNGITPLHLCAQEDHVNVAKLLCKSGADINEQTRGGFTPLHVASHFGRVNMIRFLLSNGASVNIPASSGFTPLHQASQKGNQQIVDLLLQYKAQPEALTDGGQTALSIAQNLGYVSIVETLRVITETVVKTTTMTITEEKYKMVAPETMQETFVSDSEDEAEDTAHAESVKFLTTDVMRGLGDGNSHMDVRQDEMSQDITFLSRDFTAPLDGGESTMGGIYGTASSNLGSTNQSQLDQTNKGYVYNEQALNQLSPDNVEIAKAPLLQAGFLVSFMVDARGGAMRGCRHSGVRVIIPPKTAQMPMRITCRYLRMDKLIHPPRLNDGEACASKIMEVGPAGAKFLGPVLIEVPHFASLRGREREIIILSSDDGETWREHPVEVDEKIVQSIIKQANQTDSRDKENDENRPLEDSNGSQRITKIITDEFPHYFAIISRVRREVHAVGPDGAIINSTVVPRVQATFTEGALTKRIKVDIQKEHQDRSMSPTRDDEIVIVDESRNHLGDEPGEFNETRSIRSPTPGGGSRPQSANTKRRSKFLLCFGGQGSVELLNGADLDSPTKSDATSASVEANSQAILADLADANERIIVKRHILGDVNVLDSEMSDDKGEPLSLSSIVEQIVTDDYYIEKEPPLILNSEPKTYGKRLTNQSAQTDSKLQLNNQKANKKNNKNNKKSKTIKVAPNQINQQQQQQLSSGKGSDKKQKNKKLIIAPDNIIGKTDAILDPERISIIQDVITSDDHKWRTCTIQTDSDSIVVNHVSLIDDGYCSENGDLTKQGSFGMGIFKSSVAGKGNKKKRQQNEMNKEKAIKKNKPVKGTIASECDNDIVALEKELAMRQEADLSSAKVAPLDDHNKDVVLELEQPQSLETTSASVKPPNENLTDSSKQVQQVDATERPLSPNSKQEKLRLKLEKQEKLKKEKEEKRSKKEQEEASVKAEKLKKKLEKHNKKQQQKSTSSSPTPNTPGGSPEPANDTVDSSLKNIDSSTTVDATKDTATCLILDSVLEQELPSKHEHDKDMLRVSISEKLVEEDVSTPTIVIDTSAGNQQTNEDLVVAVDTNSDQTLVISAPIEIRPSMAKNDEDDDTKKKTPELIEVDRENQKLNIEVIEPKIAKVKESSPGFLSRLFRRSKRDTKVVVVEPSSLVHITQKTPEDDEVIEPISSDNQAATDAISELKSEHLSPVSLVSSSNKDDDSTIKDNELLSSVADNQMTITEDLGVHDLSKNTVHNALNAGSCLTGVSLENDSTDRNNQCDTITNEDSTNVVTLTKEGEEEDDRTTLPNTTASVANCDPYDDDATEHVTSQCSDFNRSETGLVTPVVYNEQSSEQVQPDVAAEQIIQQIADVERPQDHELTLIKQLEDPSTKSLESLARESVIDLQQKKQSSEKKLSKKELKELQKKEKLEKKKHEILLKEQKILEERQKKEQEKLSKEQKALEEKQKKEQLKLEKQQKKLEAQRLESEKKQAKEEAKKRANEAKKQKSSKDSKSIPVEIITSSEDAPNQTETDQDVPISKEEPAEAITADKSDKSEPIQTFSEIEQTCEEVVGEDGIVTKTIKTTETKYTTHINESIEVRERIVNLGDTDAIVADEEVTGIKQAEDDQANEVVLEQNLEEEVTEPKVEYESVFMPVENGAKLSKKELKKQIKTNLKLIKKAKKLSKKELKEAKEQAKLAEAQIEVAAEAERIAVKESKKALKKAKEAEKIVKKAHKKMDKVDKKIAKKAKKLEKKQKKIDEKLAKAQKKLDKKKAKVSLKVEDIGEPVLQTSSKSFEVPMSIETISADQQVADILLLSNEQQVAIDASDHDEQYDHHHQVELDERESNGYQNQEEAEPVILSAQIKEESNDGDKLESIDTKMTSDMEQCIDEAQVRLDAEVVSGNVQESAIEEQRNEQEIEGQQHVQSNPIESANQSDPSSLMKQQDDAQIIES